MSTYTVNASFRGLYPASNGEGLTLREGTVEKATDTLVVVKIGDKQYRTFTLAKLLQVGDSATITKSDGEKISGRILAHSGDALYVGSIADKLSDARYVSLVEIAEYVK